MKIPIPFHGTVLIRNLLHLQAVFRLVINICIVCIVLLSQSFQRSERYGIPTVQQLRVSSAQIPTAEPI